MINTVKTHFGKAKKISLLFPIVVLIISCQAEPKKQYFNEEDYKSLTHLSEALTAWYEINQLNKMDNEKDFKTYLELVRKIHLECAQVEDVTLNKIDINFATQFRMNLQEGFKMIDQGFKKKFKEPTNRNVHQNMGTSDIIDGENKIISFHEYYNSNIERIVRKLRDKGVEIL